MLLVPLSVTPPAPLPLTWSPSLPPIEPDKVRVPVATLAKTVAPDHVSGAATVLPPASSRMLLTSTDPLTPSAVLPEARIVLAVPAKWIWSTVSPAMFIVVDVDPLNWTIVPPDSPVVGRPFVQFAALDHTPPLAGPCHTCVDASAGEAPSAMNAPDTARHLAIDLAQRPVSPTFTPAPFLAFAEASAGRLWSLSLDRRSPRRTRYLVCMGDWTDARRSEHMITGALVDLRPLQAEDVDQLEDVANDAAYHGPFGMFVLKGAGDIRRGFEVDGLLSDEYGRLVVVDKSGAPAGGVSYRAVSYGPPPSSLAYDIGVVIDPASRRRGYGADAQSLLARYLFDTYTIERVEASTDVENTGEQRALERAGFTREGILRRAQWRAGAWHDLVLYSKLRGE